MDLGIKGRRAIVTGGSSGIGFETARQLLEEGVRVLITGRNEGKLTKARDDLAKRTGGEVHAVVADMTKEADIAKMVAAAKEKLGGVDILVNNAGQMYSGRFAAIRDDEMKVQLETKLFGFLRAIRARLPDDEGAEMGPHRQHHRRRRQGARPVYVRQRHDQLGAAQSHQVAVDRIRRGQRAGQRNLPGLGRDPDVGSQHRGHEEGIQRPDRGGSPQDRRQEERASAHGQAGRTRQRHRIPLFGTRQLHHRRGAQYGRRKAEGCCGDSPCAL